MRETEKEFGMKDSLNNFLIILGLVAVVLCLLGWFVEYTSWFQKPNQDDTAEWVEAFLQEDEESIMARQTNDERFQKYRDHEVKLI